MITIDDDDSMQFLDSDAAGTREVVVERDGAGLISVTLRCDWPDRCSSAKVGIALEDDEVDALIAHLTKLRTPVEPEQPAQTATLIRKITTMRADADVALYKVDPPMKWGWTREGEDCRVADHVIVSAIPYVGFPDGKNPETYIFPASADGEIIDFGELDGSFQGAMDHKRALAGAGYEIK